MVLYSSHAYIAIISASCCCRSHCVELATPITDLKDKNYDIFNGFVNAITFKGGKLWVMKVGAESPGRREGVENSIGCCTHNVLSQSVPLNLSVRNFGWVGLGTSSFST